MYGDLMTQRTMLKGRLTSLKPGDKLVLQGKLAKEIDDLDKLLGSETEIVGLDSRALSEQDLNFSSSGDIMDNFNHKH